MDFDDTVARYHQAANAFAEGDPEPIKALLSDRDDIMLANPFGPAVFGREKVAEAPEICCVAISRRRGHRLRGHLPST